MSVNLERVHLRDIQQGDAEVTYRSNRALPMAESKTVGRVTRLKNFILFLGRVLVMVTHLFGL